MWIEGMMHNQDSKSRLIQASDCALPQFAHDSPAIRVPQNWQNKRSLDSFWGPDRVQALVCGVHALQNRVSHSNTFENPGATTSELRDGGG